jgi:hypothetical protein
LRTDAGAQLGALTEIATPSGKPWSAMTFAERAETAGSVVMKPLTRVGEPEPTASYSRAYYAINKPPAWLAQIFRNGMDDRNGSAKRTAP